ncbi:MAG: ABC transporter substrate-binding protein [Candidatus Cloacimonetes bacterium]|nr:ABC transporter substrate-binding protein [Candidatus Cloacimonadota bacterium]
MKKIFIISFVLLIIIISGCTSKKEITIAALLSLTGDLSSSGLSAQAACEIAERDINSYLTCIGKPYSFHIEFEDTQTDPIVALRKARLMHSKGIKTIIGVQSSSELANIMPFADKNRLVVISTESTAPALAIEDDFIFRLVPDDTQQAKAIVQLLEILNYKVIIPFFRNDSWGIGLMDGIKQELKNSSIQLLDGIAFDPLTKDFQEDLTELSIILKSTVKTHDPEECCVYFLAFEESALIFESLHNYPTCTSVRWFGSDGTARNEGLRTNEQAAQTAINVQFINPMYSPEKTEKALFLDLQLTKKYNLTPSSYTSAAYDACWLAALSHIVTKNGDSEEIAKAFIHTANAYYGCTGWTVLNKTGDRKDGNYDFWEIENKNGSYEWTSTMTFIGNNHTINTP